METSSKSLPPEAYRELAPGETYRPYVPAGSRVPEITARSVLWGLFMSLFFTFSVAYLGLKVGTVPEAAIPEAILAVGIGYVYKRKSTILENVILQSIGVPEYPNTALADVQGRVYNPTNSTWSTA